MRIAVLRQRTWRSAELLPELRSKGGERMTEMYVYIGIVAVVMIACTIGLWLDK